MFARAFSRTLCDHHEQVRASDNSLLLNVLGHILAYKKFELRTYICNALADMRDMRQPKIAAFLCEFSAV